MINTIDLKTLRNGEFLQFQTDLLAIIGLNNPTALHVQAQYAALTSKVQEVEALFRTDPGNPITDEIQALDARRDAAVNGLLFVARGYANHYDENIRAYATKLNNHLELFGVGIARDNYQSETASIRNIVNDWGNKPELSEALGNLKLESRTGN
jgi:hypothetical protein